MRLKSTKQKSSYQDGIALLEFTLVVPILLAFSIAVVDMTRWIVTYTDTSRVAYEGARYAASIRDLTEAVAVVDPVGEDFIPSDAHGQVITRMQRVMTEQSMSPSETYVRVERQNASTTNSIEVEVQVPFQPYAARLVGVGILESIREITVCRVTVRAPYLYPEST